MIHRSGNELLSLIDEILDLSKIEAGRMSLNVNPVSVQDIARGMRGAFSHVAADKGLDFGVEVSPQVPETIGTDAMRLQQVLKNLIANAIKFTDAGTVTVHFDLPKKDVDLSLSGLKHDSAIAISVMDTGIGIAEDLQKVIFEAFQQADGTTSRKYGGTGLGLSISKELIRLLGGEIQLKSSPGQGAAFEVYLPFELAVIDDERPSAMAPAPPPATPPSPVSMSPTHEELATGAARTILIVEDDDRFTEVLTSFCSDSGFSCLTASTGERGLALARKHLPDAIVLDIGLPRIDGWQVLEHLKSDTKTRHIPVYVISGEEATTKAFRKGAIGHLQKPVTPEGLKGAFDRIEHAAGEGVRSVLVVEDDDAVRRGIVELVREKDVRVDEASGANEAIEAILANQYDCVILDLGLWDMDGEKLLEAVRQDEHAELPPVIVYTGRELSRAEEMRLREYSDSIIIKDARSEERLLDEVSLFLHRVVSDMPPKKRQIIVDLHDPAAGLEGKKVLIVEDDMRSAFALSNLLVERGMVALKAEHGQTALKLLAENPDVDLVLMDIMMPVMDGLETMKRIRKQEAFSKLPIIALTAKAMKNDAEQCLAAGANDYLAKPVDERRLLSMMRVWLYDG